MIDFESRLKSLKDRRQGVNVRSAFESLVTNQEAFDLRSKEKYENLAESASIKYTIGAMAPVEGNSTQVSISEGQRVADSLIKSLASKNIKAISRLQGSVALDIHIKGHSDVDMLIIKEDIIQVQLPVVTSYEDVNDTRTMEDIIKEIRLESETILPINFPQVTINCKGNKSITMEGGSLKRKVDIVPASWYDTRDYQSSQDESDRGIKIYHKADHTLIKNFPFKHIHLINNRNTRYNGNLKMVIRLMKNMIADMPDYKKNVAKKLSSYDLASIAYHMDKELYLSYDMRLGLVEKIRKHLNNLLKNKSLRDALDVPDGSRRIFDIEEKVKSLEILEKEFEDLALAIFKDLKPFINAYDSNVILSKRVA